MEIGMDNCLQVGGIVTSHGVHGEAKVFSTTDDMTRFKKLKTVLMESKDGVVELHITGVKFFKQFVIVKFEEFNTPEEIMKIKGRPIWVKREDAVKLKKDEYFIADLIGLSVLTDDDNELGVIEDVIVTGANDVYDVRMPNGKEVLIPAIKDCILDVNIEDGFMRVHLLEGLLE